MSNSLHVYLNGKKIGLLQKDGAGGMIFKYEDKAEHILSLSLPVSDKPYANKDCSGFFNGLLPESENTRKILGKKYGINSKNDFSLLSAIGYDCAGAVSFFEKEQNNLKEFYEIDYDALTESRLEEYIKELPKKPLASGAGGLRLSLAGVQDKTALILNGSEIGLPRGNTPSTHILKPEIEGLNESIENEYICMKAAEKLGINVPEVQIKYAGSIKYLLINRYDREIKNEKIKRIHQEDFSQALNIPSAYKYQAEGGAGFKQCYEILRRTSKPALSIKQFNELMVFNFLINNNDAHGKNFSILHHENGLIEFAPAYDILCTAVYPELSKKAAMKTGGHYKHSEIMLRHFEKLSLEVNISFPQLNKIIQKQCRCLPAVLEEIINSFDNTIGSRILAAAEKNCRRLKAGD